MSDAARKLAENAVDLAKASAGRDSVVELVAEAIQAALDAAAAEAYERAAREAELSAGLSPAAVSQRIRALAKEAATG